MLNKTFITVVLLMVITTVVWYLNIAEAEPSFVTEGLISFWTFDADTIEGDTVKDVWGENDGTMHGNPKISKGKINEAIELDGVDDFVSIDDPKSIPSGNDAYAIELWFNANTIGERGFMGWGNYGTGNQVTAFRLRKNGCEGEPPPLVGEGDAGGCLRHYWWGKDVGVQIGDVTGEWHHAIAQFDGTTRSLWLDGDKLIEDQPGEHDAKAENVTIGVTFNTEFFDGIIDEVRLYNRALTEAEIRSNVTAVKPAGKLSTCWGKIKASK